MTNVRKFQYRPIALQVGDQLKKVDEKTKTSIEQQPDFVGLSPLVESANTQALLDDARVKGALMALESAAERVTTLGQKIFPVGATQDTDTLVGNIAGGGLNIVGDAMRANELSRGDIQSLAKAIEHAREQFVGAISVNAPHAERRLLAEGYVELLRSFQRFGDALALYLGYGPAVEALENDPDGARPFFEAREHATALYQRLVGDNSSSATSMNKALSEMMRSMQDLVQLGPELLKLPRGVSAEEARKTWTVGQGMDYEYQARIFHDGAVEFSRDDHLVAKLHVTDLTNPDVLEQHIEIPRKTARALVAAALGDHIEHTSSKERESQPTHIGSDYLRLKIFDDSTVVLYGGISATSPIDVASFADGKIDFEDPRSNGALTRHKSTVESLVTQILSGHGRS